MKILAILFATWVMMTLAACQVAPTRVRESATPQQDEQSLAHAIAALQEQNPVFLDVRSPMDYGLTHVPGSVNVRWEDFSRPGQAGALDPDFFALARRMALWGVSPQRLVIVVGDGAKGLGEEGRVAWTLKVLGVEKVLTVTSGYFRNEVPRGEERPENAPMWKPKIRDELEVAPLSFKRKITEPLLPGVTRARKAARQEAPIPPGLPPFFLDVRRELLQEGLTNEQLLALGFKEVPPRVSWDKFFESGTGFPKKDLSGFPLPENKDREVIVFDHRGVAACAVAYVLLESGYKARCLSSGLRSVTLK